MHPRADWNLDSLRHNNDALPLRHCRRRIHVCFNIKLLLYHIREQKCNQNCFVN